MRLLKARVQNYRSVHDTGWFDVETDKTVLVGPNDAGKTAVFRALQTVSMPPGQTPELEVLRDCPRSRLNEFSTGGVKPENIEVASAVFSLDDSDRQTLGGHAPHLADTADRVLTMHYEKRLTYNFGGVALWAKFGDIEKPLATLRGALGQAGESAQPVVAALIELTKTWPAPLALKGSFGTKLDSWLDTAAEHLDLDIEKTDKAFDAVRAAARRDSQTAAASAAIKTRVPFFVYFLAVLQGPAAHSPRSTRCARSCR